MYVEALDRGIIRKAVNVMANLALDELAAKEVDELDAETIAFILAALNSVIKNTNRTYVSDYFGEYDIRRVTEITTGLTAVTTGVAAPRIDLTGKVMLSEDEVAVVLAESDELTRRLNAITERLAYLQRALHVSGETKLREMRHIRTWYYDGETTHGIKGLATVTNVRTQNLVGVGPDHVYVGTAEELATYLRAIGYTEIETDLEILSIAWRKTSGS